jgi:hypothetical protein
MAKEPAKNAEVGDVYPDAWDRFRNAVHVMAKAGPQHRIGGATVKNVPKERPATKGRVHKGKTPKKASTPKKARAVLG